jgi:hypothetical protein
MDLIAAKILALDPVNYLRYSELSGTSAADASGNGLTGTMNGGYTRGVAGLVRSSNDAGVALIAASQGRVAVSHHAILNLTAALTIFARIATSSASEQFICAKGDDSWFFAVNGGGSGSGKLTGYLGGVSAGWLVGATTVSDGLPHTVGLTYDGAHIRLWVDGVVDASIAATGSISIGSTALEWGRRSTDAAKALDGVLDEAAIFSAALTAGQMLDLHNACVAAPVMGYDDDITSYTTAGTFGAALNRVLSALPASGTLAVNPTADVSAASRFAIAAAAAAAVAATKPAPGADSVALWKLDDAAGVAVLDATGSHTLTLVNAPTWGGYDGGYNPERRPGSFLSFNGTDEYATNATALASARPALTIALRFRWDAAPAPGERVMHWLGKRTGAGSDTYYRGLSLWHADGIGTRLSLYLGTALDDDATVNLDGPLLRRASLDADALGVWFDVVLVSGPAGTKLYTGGVLDASDDTLLVPWEVGDGVTPLAFGAAYESSASNYGQVSVDDVRIDARQWSRGEAVAYAERRTFEPAETAYHRLTPVGAILTPSQAWEQYTTPGTGACQEFEWSPFGEATPTGYYVAGYSEGTYAKAVWANVAALEAGTAPTKTQILGNGAGGYAGDVFHASRQFELDGQRHFYFSSHPSTGDLTLATSDDDGVTWTTQEAIAASVGAWFTNAGNSVAIVRGGKVYVLVEGQDADGIWKTRLYSGTDPAELSPEHDAAFLRGLQAIPNGMAGGFTTPVEANGRLYLPYHYGPFSNEPTYVTVAESPSLTDLLNFVRSPFGPVITFEAGTPFAGCTQTSDPSIIQFGDDTYVSYAGTDNQTPYAAIYLSKAEGMTPAELLVPQVGEAARVKLHTTQPDYAPAKAGDNMGTVSSVTGSVGSLAAQAKADVRAEASAELTARGMTSGWAEEVDAAALSAATAAGTAAAHATTLVGRITSTLFSGMTSLPNWLRALVRSSAPDATALSEINSGGGAYSAATDSLQANADAVAATGTGGRTVTVTVTDEDAGPLENAFVRLTAGAETFFGYTDDDGELVFNVNDATYVVAITKPGYQFAGDTLAVDGDETPDPYVMEQVVIPAATEPGQTTAYTYVRGHNGSLVTGQVVTVRLVDPRATRDTWYRRNVDDTSNEQGVASWTLKTDTDYEIRYGRGAWFGFRTGSAATYHIQAEVLGEHGT